jgi:hypothetical protein
LQNLEVDLDLTDGGLQMPSDQPYQYAANFICSGTAGPDGSSLAGNPTFIHILNPNSWDIEFAKRISLRGPGQTPGVVSDWIRDRLGPYETLSVTCQQIPTEFTFESIGGKPKFTVFEGFLIVECDVSLVVTAVYIAAGAGGDINSIHVEQINERYKGVAKKRKKKSKRKRKSR